MADELLKSRHAFGKEENIDIALKSGAIDAYDILFLKDARDKPKIGWIDKNGNKVIINNDTGILFLLELPEVGEIEKIYIVNGIAYVWNGEEFITLNGEMAEIEEKVSEGVTEAIEYTDNRLAEIEEKLIEVEKSTMAFIELE